MDYIIDGKHPLCGELSVYGAKNCALALLGASVLTKDAVTLTNCPQIVDVENMLGLLSALGKNVVRLGETVTVQGDVISAVPRKKAGLLRGSGLVLGGLVSSCGEAFLPSTGGCAIGARPIDIHLEGLRALGVEVSESEVGVRCFGKPRGGEFTLRFPSVGATENLLCAAALARGETILRNCALEPEVIALEHFLVALGAKLSGIGTHDVTIRGVEQLHGAEFSVIPDRIVACTYLACCAAACGSIVLTNCVPAHFNAFLDVLSQKFDVTAFPDAVKLKVNSRPESYGRITTAPYPAFPTDVQQPMLSLCASCNGGVSFVTENLFENRLSHNSEQLNKMGACVEVRENTARVVGQNLHGADVCAHDLRGGAGLVVAALAAEGVTTLRKAEHISRGYRDMAAELKSLGAEIRSK